jgi:peptide/nickel transport system permease protein
MLRYAIKRLVLFIPTLLVVLFITYALGYFGPGDPLLYQYYKENPSGRMPDEATLERLRHVYGLDRPFLTRWTEWGQNLLRGDLGTSLITRRPIGPSIAQRFPVSAQLGLVAFVLMAVAGTALGAITAIKQNTWIDHAIVGFFLFISSVPIFVLAPLSLIVVMLWLKLPSALGWDGLFTPKAILPILLFSVPGWLGIIRMTRSGLIQVLSEDYVRTARAKGLPERLVILRHMIKNGLLGTVTTLGLSVSGMVTGSLFLEAAFGIPGYGSLAVQGLLGSDYDVIMATTLLGAILVMLANLITDLAYGFLDPRVRYS